jgi:hypothetical protein
MNKKALPIVLAVIILALLAILIFVPGKTANPSPVATYTSTSQPTPTTTDVIQLPNPESSTSTLSAYASLKGKTVKISLAQNSQVISPIIITGNIPSGWAFEASFPVKLLDANGTVIGQGAARVPNWMSTTTAWFAVGVSFAKPTTSTGTLVLLADNPSGSAANADEVHLPVKF